MEEVDASLRRQDVTGEHREGRKKGLERGVVLLQPRVGRTQEWKTGRVGLWGGVAGRKKTRMFSNNEIISGQSEPHCWGYLRDLSLAGESGREVEEVEKPLEKNGTSNPFRMIFLQFGLFFRLYPDRLPLGPLQLSVLFLSADFLNSCLRVLTFTRSFLS